VEAAGLTLARQHDDDVLTFAASSEEPVERWYGTEVLSHEPGAIRLDRAKAGAMPLLFNHRLDDPIGMILSAAVQDNRLMVEARLFKTARAAEVKTMIEGGLRNVSIAYRTNTVEEDVKKHIFRATDWEPLEVSMVTVPADPTVGIGRADDREYTVRMITASNHAAPAAHKEERAMPDEKKDAAAAVEEKPAELKPVEYEQVRIKAIENLCKMSKLDDKYRDMFIGQGLSVEQVSDECLKIQAERTKHNPQTVAKIGLTVQDVNRYSIVRALEACIQQSWAKTAPFELECSRAIQDKLGVAADPHKFYIPYEVLQRPVAVKRGQRDLNVATVGDGGYLSETQNVGFIDMVRNRSVAFSMGARRLSGLTGSVTIPRMSAAGTPYWQRSETDAATESQQTFQQVSLTPKTAVAYTEISRRLLLQSNPGAEGIVTDDLAQIVALAADQAALRGAGSLGEPQGIIGTSGVGSVAAGSLNYDKILELQTDLADANVMPAAGGYVTVPSLARLAMTRQRFSSTDTPLWVGNVWDGQVSGFRAMSSNQLIAASANILFGDWSELVIAEWGVLEVEVNPYANFQAGIIGVRCMYSIDVGVRRPYAFSLTGLMT